MDTKKRSLYKTISWHLVHIVMVSIIAITVTGSIKIAAILASTEMFLETFLFFAHERVWANLSKKVR